MGTLKGEDDKVAVGVGGVAPADEDTFFNEQKGSKLTKLMLTLSLMS